MQILDALVQMAMIIIIMTIGFGVLIRGAAGGRAVIGWYVRIFRRLGRWAFRQVAHLGRWIGRHIARPFRWAWRTHSQFVVGIILGIGIGIALTLYVISRLP